MTTVRAFTSTQAGPADRGREFGEHHRSQVAGTVAAYRRLFAARASRPFDADLWAERAWTAIAQLAPGAAEEIQGIADGAGLPVREVAMLNARTELLAVADPAGGADECSTVVALPPGGAPVAVQTWDWYTAMADGWLLWTIPHPSGPVVQTVTEYGVLGKIGVNSHGVGVFFNMLRHQDDALTQEQGLGFPVHLLSRRILDLACSVDEALTLARSVTTSASTALTVVDSDGRAASVELFRGGPGLVEPEDGLLVRTNHFVSRSGRDGCLAASIGPGSRIRRKTLLSAFTQDLPSDAQDVIAAMDDHAAVGAVCAHADPDDPPVLRHSTLTTVAIDVAARQLAAAPGGPCTP